MPATTTATDTVPKAPAQQRPLHFILSFQETLALCGYRRLPTDTPRYWDGVTPVCTLCRTIWDTLFRV